MFFRRKKIVEVNESNELLVAQKNGAVLKMQCLVRKYIATKRVMRKRIQSWEHVFDPQTKRYFWFNKITFTSRWLQPDCIKFPFTSDEISATKQIQRVVRGFNGRMVARKFVHAKYTRFYDSKLDRFYWLNNETEKTTWNVSLWLQHQEVPIADEDLAIYEARQKIKELEERLQDKEQEIVEVRKQRYEELEYDYIKDKVSDAKALKRSKHMDEWSVVQLAAWFIELKMEEFVPFIYKNSVDGNLFINLSEADWQDMGIKNRFHVRKLNLILKPYRVRYQRRKEELGDDEDEQLSECAPSELSDMLNAEDDDTYDDDENDEGFEKQRHYGEVYGGDENDEGGVYDLTDEQRQEMALDDDNIHIQTIIPGDEESFPIVGDVVRIKYVCTLASDGKTVASSRHGMQRKDVEFVLGVGQVVKGFDRGLMQMSTGQRCKITCTSEYGYGRAGLPPNIPPDAELAFDVTLLGFKPRPLWIKPLIQQPGLSERPYWDIEEAEKDTKLLHYNNNTRLPSIAGTGGAKQGVR